MDHLNYLSEIVDKDLPDNLKSVCFYVLGDVRFQNGMGGSTHHHNYPGGLIEHTAEVVAWIKALAGPHYNLPVVLTAAIWHDFHKIYEYEWDSKKSVVNRLDYLTTVGHVTGSATEFQRAAERLYVAEDYTPKIVHCMLSHHGRKEWGSPVEPTTPEAWLLHSADMLSSRGKKVQ